MLIFPLISSITSTEGHNPIVAPNVFNFSGLNLPGTTGKEDGLLWA